MNVRAARSWTLCLAVALAGSAASAQVDLSGRWQDEGGNFIDIVQTGTSATVCSTAFLPPCFNGTVSTVNNIETLAFGDATLQVTLQLSGTHLDGWGVNILAIVIARVFWTRCQCNDGNANDGDGCNAHCQIEPCFSCSGDPSVCTPLADGAACEDGSPCTTGETCSASLCGGGSPVTPCTDLTGRWLIHNTLPDFNSSEDVHTDISQTGNEVFLRDATTGFLGLWGMIDPSAGTFQLRQPAIDFECGFEEVFDTLTGSAAAGGASWSGTGFLNIDNTAHMFCLSFEVVATATRCGGGTLDPGEACDDGNIENGDGCSASCQIEPSALCGSMPRSGCRHAPSSRLIVRKSAQPAMRKLIWAWTRGAAAALGDPVSGTTAYALCVYGTTASVPYLATQLHVPAGGNCAGIPCWVSTDANGVRYRDPAAAADGVVALRARTGAAGRAKVRLQARGTALPIPVPANAASLIAADPQVTAQLVNADGSCWEATYSAAQSTLDPARFSGQF